MLRKIARATQRCFATIDKMSSNAGKLDPNQNDVGTGWAGSPACGDVLKLQIQVNQGVISKAVFKTFGCGSAIASSNYATELLQGKKLEDAVGIKNSDIASHLKLPPVKLHCSILAEEAIQNAIKDYKSKHEGKKDLKKAFEINAEEVKL